MRSMDALKKAAIDKKISLSDISKSMGKTRGYINATITRNSEPKVNTYVCMLDACDYALCAIPKDKVTNDMLVIDNE